jgi:hypothetical protein
MSAPITSTPNIFLGLVGISILRIVFDLLFALIDER